jgi:CheY-like chemotaxis protein
MTATTERRDGPDRRRQPRGGRRPTDRPGFSPLVLVVERDPHGRDTCEAILAKLRFAVAPVESVERALEVMAGLRPDVIVAREGDVSRLCGEMQLGPRAISAPVVVTNENRDPEALVEDIRRALRGR